MGRAASHSARDARRQIEGKKNRACVFRRFRSQNYRSVSNCARHAPFFLRRCLLISIFPRAELEYVCPPSGQGEGGELQWREDGATKRNRCEKRGAVRRKRGTKQKYSRRPIHFFPIVFVPLLSERVLRRPESTPCAPIACARTLASTGFRFLPSLLHSNATLCCD